MNSLLSQMEQKLSPSSFRLSILLGIISFLNLIQISFLLPVLFRYKLYPYELSSGITMKEEFHQVLILSKKN